jgi:DNA-binding HxlR family transcriptional regulator
LTVVGDRWALLVLRELDSGVHRFNDIHANTGAPRDRLASRLRELEEAGLIIRRRYSERPPRDEYVLTSAGSAIGPVLRELRIWGETYAREARVADYGSPRSASSNSTSSPSWIASAKFSEEPSR